MMNGEWRFKAKSVTKYDPVYRDADGRYTKEEWIGFFQIGKTIAGKVLTFDDFFVVEARYIKAAKLFFAFHGCEDFTIRNLEQNGFEEHSDPELAKLKETYDLVGKEILFPIEELDNIIKLILRDMIWAELFCGNDDTVAVRFGSDLYMYFNSAKNWDVLRNEIQELGLYVD